MRSGTYPPSQELRRRDSHLRAMLVATPLAVAAGAIAARWCRQHQLRRERAQRSFIAHIGATIHRPHGMRRIGRVLRGLPRGSLTRKLGLPDAVERGGVIAADPSSTARRQSSVWYYRLDREAAGGAALVVIFGRDGRAHHTALA